MRDIISVMSSFANAIKQNQLYKRKKGLNEVKAKANKLPSAEQSCHRLQDSFNIGALGVFHLSFI